MKSYVLSFYGYFKSKMIKKSNLRRLEIGAGNKKRDGFITLDLSLHVDVPYDLLMGLPFPDNTFELIYAEHVLEHFAYKDLKDILKECLRCLKKGGVLKIAVPNTKIWIDGYFSSDFDINEYCRYEFGLEYLSNIDYLNYIFYMDEEHKYMFDEKNIIELFLKIGFKEAKIRDFEEDLDKPERKSTSLYAMAIK
jgi:predicted SAM-dependent methyltransferase